MLTSPSFNLFSSTILLNSMKPEHSCKMVYDVFQINVYASDGRRPEGRDQTQVILTVDIDQFDPSFGLPRYEVIISEKQPMFDPIITVEAGDTDRRVSLDVIEE